MKKLMYGLLASAAIGAIALNVYVDHLQAQPQPFVPSQQVQLTEVILKVTTAELDIISEGLQTQPFGKVVPLINKLRAQLIEQQPKPVMPAVPVPTPAPEVKE